MDIQTLNGENRRPAGSRAAERLRRAGKLPAIVYGHEQDPAPVVLNYREVEHHIHAGAHLVNLQIGASAQPCLFKDVQYDHLGIKLLHVDLARVDLNERVKVHVPIELRGHAKGVADGGVLHQELAEIEIECPVTQIPDSIRVNVSDIALDQVLHVKEIPLEPGIVATLDPETVVLTVRVPVEKVTTTAMPAEGEAGAAEPEVIARGKAPEEEAEG